MVGSLSYYIVLAVVPYKNAYDRLRAPHQLANAKDAVTVQEVLKEEEVSDNASSNYFLDSAIKRIIKIFHCSRSLLY